MSEVPLQWSRRWALACWCLRRSARPGHEGGLGCHWIHSHPHTPTREHREESAVALTFTLTEHRGLLLVHVFQVSGESSHLFHNPFLVQNTPSRGAIDTEQVSTTRASKDFLMVEPSSTSSLLSSLELSDANVYEPQTRAQVYEP